LKNIERKIWLGWLIFLRVIQMRTRRAVLGVFWILAPLLLFAGGASFVVNQLGIAADLSGEVPYPLFVLTGIVMWQTAADALQHAMYVARRTASYGRSVHVPAISIVTAVFCYTLLYLAIKMPVAIGVGAWYGHYGFFTPQGFLLLGLSAGGMMLFGTAVGLLFAPLSYMLFDFRYLPPYILRILIFTAPVFFLPPAGFFEQVMRFNPLAILVGSGRAAMLGVDGWTPLLTTLPAVLAMASLLLVAVTGYRAVLRRAVVFM
jgi:lipopolysaccharide transport system permease protein